MSDHKERPVRFHELNWLGRAAFLGGEAVRLTANAIDKGVQQAARTWVEAEDAFKREVDPNIEDAVILEEMETPADTSEADSPASGGSAG